MIRGVYGFFFLLAACTQSKNDLKEQVLLKTTTEVSEWIADTQVSTLARESKEPTLKSGRPLNIKLLSGPVTFYAHSDVSKADQKNIAVERLMIHRVVTDETRSKSLFFESTKTHYVDQENNSNIGLSQANQEEIRYVGQMVRDGIVLAMVGVGERLYPVKSGDLIGLGQWRVELINSDVMLLRIGSKVMSYDKN